VDDLKKRANSCLQGAALGDAMGKMTEGYWPEQIIENYGDKISNFHDPIQTKSAHSWKRAEVTDDTSFTILLAESIIENGQVNGDDIIEKIVNHPKHIKGWPAWNDFSSAVKAGSEEVERFSRWRDGNGAASRVSPIGIIHGHDELDQIVEDVFSACSMTHGARSALSGACALAAAVSAAIDGGSRREILGFALQAAVMGERMGSDDCRPVAPRISLGMKFVDEYRGIDLSRDLCQVLNPGFSAYEGVPYALSLVYGYDDAWDVILAAVNEGGDADSVASMAGCVSASMYPDTLPRDLIKMVLDVNSIEMRKLALKLLELRHV
jgi:ADP-ribosylglycohydrolase